LRSVSAAAAPAIVNTPRMKNGSVTAPGTSSSIRLIVSSSHYLAF
jgi:hypothetical protein